MNPVAFQLRVMQVAMIISVFLFFFVSRTLPHPEETVSPAMQWVIVACAFTSALSGFIIQRLVISAPRLSLRASQNSTLVEKWKMGHIIRFATAESVALFGFVLRDLGSSPQLVYLLFGSGLALFLIWQPGAVPTENVSQSPIH